MQFTVNITGGEKKTPAPETGAVRFDSGSVTIAHSSSPLIGAEVNGDVICQGTRAYNGPYKIQAVADPQDIASMMEELAALRKQQATATCLIHLSSITPS